MRQFLEILTFVIIGVALFWLGLTLFTRFGIINREKGSKDNQDKKDDKQNDIKPMAKGPAGEGDPNKTCPVCSSKLSKGELVSSSAFPSTNGGTDRFMHIRGCVYCLNGDRKRVCPVCGTVLEANEILIARLFERVGRRTHIHVIGCTQCKKGPKIK
jgi:hypothetical protein